MTAQQFIDRTLTLIGRLRPGQGAGPSESSMALEMLNQLLGGWNTEHLSIYNIKNQQFALISGQGHYTFGDTGSGASFEVGRPVKIQSAGIIRAGLRFPLDLINSQQWDMIREKEVPLTSSLGIRAMVPLSLYNDNAYPVATLHLWPIPDDGSLAGGASVEDTLWRTLLLKDTTPGNDIADHLTVQEPGRGTKITAVLRKAISADLTVQVVKNGTIIGTITVHQATAIDQPVSLDISNITFIEDEVLSWNVTASDSQTDIGGVAAVTVEWKKSVGVGNFTGGSLDLSWWLALSGVATLSATFDMPPGYQRALMFALAVEVATQFPGIQLPQSVVAIANQAKADIQRLNASNNIPAEDVPAGPAAAA